MLGSVHLQSLRATHAPGTLNCNADLLSRGNPLYANWRLHPKVVEQDPGFQTGWPAVCFLGKAATGKACVHTASFPLDCGAYCPGLNQQGCPTSCRFACTFHGLFLREFPFGKYVQLLAGHLFTLLLGFIGWMSQHPLWHIQSLGQGPVKTQPSCEVPLGDSCLPYRHVQRYGSQYVFPILGHETNAMKAKEGISLISMSVSADNPLCYGSEEEVSSF